MPAKKTKQDTPAVKPPEPSVEEVAAQEEFLKVTYEKTRKSLIERLYNWEDQNRGRNFTGLTGG